MRKALIRVICLSLCLVLYLSSAAFAEDARVAMGRYVETKLDLYGDWRAFTQTNGGSTPWTEAGSSCSRA